MPSRKLEDLYEPLRIVIEKALKIAELMSLKVTITCTLRTPQEQMALFAQGREPLEVTNKLRKDVGLYLLSAEENQKKVTWVTSSYHTIQPKSMAVDYAIGESGKITWDLKSDTNKNSVTDYKEFATICKIIDPVNIEWGGDWETTDACHIQWRNGKNIKQV